MFNLTTLGMVLVLVMPFVILSLWAIVHASIREFDTLGHKAIWMMVAAIPFVGFLIYFLFGARKSRKSIPATTSESEQS